MLTQLRCPPGRRAPSTIVFAQGALCLLLCLAAPAARGGPGEFSIPSTNPLRPEQLISLRHLAQTDAEARAIADAVAAEAAPLLGATPRPLEVIHYEGLVNTDPRRIATVEKLREMAAVARLMRYWQVSGDARAAAALRRFITAWARTYRPTGNDVNENKLYPLLVAYHGLRGEFAADEKAAVDAWVSELGALHAAAVGTSTHYTNRYAKHVRLAAIAGMILGKDEWVATAREGVRRFVSRSLYADGSSLDLKRRDTLTYHASGLRPVVELAMLAGDAGPALYKWESPEGGSIKRSVDFVVPYALGEKTRREWTHSKVDLDRRRAEAGLEKYQSGRAYDPKDALKLMEEASYFDPTLMRVVRHLTGSAAERFPTWQTLVNEAARAGGADPAR